MLARLVTLGLLIPIAAHAQVITSMRTNNPAPIKGDPNKIVCQTEERIGTRLGAKKVCLKVSEWQARRNADRQFTEGIQAGARVCSNPPCPNPWGR